MPTVGLMLPPLVSLELKLAALLNRESSPSSSLILSGRVEIRCVCMFRILLDVLGLALLVIHLVKPLTVLASNLPRKDWDGGPRMVMMASICSISFEPTNKTRLLKSSAKMHPTPHKSWGRPYE
eukprot:Lithocolla_globosa_v1_NODE_2221_length_2104_cov_10.998536.p2 type:complete len:124 gc:universal NODE_2221_length_2104_cov_10.998536:640-1011(+)